MVSLDMENREYHDDAVKFHAVKAGSNQKVSMEVKEVKNNKTSSVPIFQNVFGKLACELGKSRKDTVCITAAMREGTGLVEYSKMFPDRYYDVGIAEGHAVTFASRLATQGIRPIVAIYSTFLQRAYDHIIHDCAIQHLPVIFCLDRSGIAGEDGPTHHGALDLSYLRCIQELILTAPKNGNEFRNLCTPHLIFMTNLLRLDTQNPALLNSMILVKWSCFQLAHGKYVKKVKMV